MSLENLNLKKWFYEPQFYELKSGKIIRSKTLLILSKFHDLRWIFVPSDLKFVPSKIKIFK